MGESQKLRKFRDKDVQRILRETDFVVPDDAFDHDVHPSIEDDTHESKSEPEEKKENLTWVATQLKSEGYDIRVPHLKTRNALIEKLLKWKENKSYKVQVICKNDNKEMTLELSGYNSWRRYPAQMNRVIFSFGDQQHHELSGLSPAMLEQVMHQENHKVWLKWRNLGYFKRQIKFIQKKVREYKPMQSGYIEHVVLILETCNGISMSRDQFKNLETELTKMFLELNELNQEDREKFQFSLAKPLRIVKDGPLLFVGFHVSSPLKTYRYFYLQQYLNTF